MKYDLQHLSERLDNHQTIIINHQGQLLEARQPYDRVLDLFHNVELRLNGELIAEHPTLEGALNLILKDQ